MTVDVEAYLNRINYRGPLEPTPGTLRRLHRAHMLSVPFENLDIHLNRPVVLDDERLLSKIVAGRRGGFCYELNGAFAALLRELGFEVKMLSACVASEAGGFGPAFDHMALVVEMDRRWLADVGFGDSFLEPLRLDDAGPQMDATGAYRIAREGDDLIMERELEDEWKPQYRFTLQPYVYADYDEMCRHHQTSPESPFTRKRTCSLATVDGRITLSGMRLITTGRGGREERVVRDATEYGALLGELFGIQFDDGDCETLAR